MRPIVARLGAERYDMLRRTASQRWRPAILERDGGICRACGSGGPLHLAHITAAAVFARAWGLRGVSASYRWDNLVMLCIPCHRAQHGSEELPQEERRRRATCVHLLFDRIRAERGWRGPYKLWDTPSHIELK